MTPKLLSLLLAALAAMPAAIDAASVTTPRQAADSNTGFVSFPIQRGQRGQRGQRSSSTLSGRQATASLINEQDTSYTIALAFGSNAQAVHVAIDTGSDELFVDPNCNDREFTSGQRQQCQAEGNYDPATSTTARDTGTTSSITYGSGAVNLAYFVDTIGIPGASKNLTKVQFGKATASQSLSEGILGLGFGNGVNLNYPNFVDALQQQGLTNTRAFSVALGTSNTVGGAIVFGGVDTKKFSGKLTQIDIATSAARDIQRYAVALTSIGYNSGSTTKQYDDSALTGVVLDTGSSLCELPADIVSAMAADVGAQLDRQSGLLVMDCAAATAARKFEFAFAGGVTIAAPLSQLVLQSGGGGGGGGACVLGVAALPAGSSGVTALLGDTFLRNAYVVFDQTYMKIGLAQYAACGTHVQAIPAGSAGAGGGGFTGECAASADAVDSSSNDGGRGVGARHPAAEAVFALVAGLVALVSLF